MTNGSSEQLTAANVKKVIGGRNIYLRPLEEGDISENYIGWLNDKKLNQFLEIRHQHHDRKNVIRYINALRRSPGCDLFGVFTKKNDAHVGNMSLTKYNPNGQGFVDYGIMIGEAWAQNLGLGGEVHIMLLEYVFSDPAILRLNAGMYSTHVHAIKTILALGYTLEGVIRNRIVQADGEICDVNMYGMLKEEWAEKRAPFKAIVNSVSIVDYDPT